MNAEVRKLGQRAVKLQMGMEAAQESLRKALNRLPRDVKQTDMARGLSVSTAAISDFLTGNKDFSVETMKKVAVWGRKKGV